MVLSSGLSVKFAQNQVGHSKTETTLNVYARNNDDMVNTAQFVINDIFSHKEKNKEIIAFVIRLQKSILSYVTISLEAVYQ